MGEFTKGGGCKRGKVQDHQRYLKVCPSLHLKQEEGFPPVEKVKE